MFAILMVIESRSVLIPLLTLIAIGVMIWNRNPYWWAALPISLIVYFFAAMTKMDSAVAMRIVEDKE